MVAKTNSWKSNTSKYIFLFVLIFATLIILIPILKILLTSFILTFVSFPLYAFIRKKTKMPRLSSLITVIIVVIVTIIPFVLIVNSLIHQVSSVGTFITKVQNITLSNQCAQGNTSLWCSTVGKLIHFKSGSSFLNVNFNNITNKIYSGVYKLVLNMALAAPNLVVVYLFVIFITYFLLIDGERLIAWLKEHLPVKKKIRETMFHELNDVSRSVIFGQLIVSAVQGLAGGIGLYLGGLFFSVPNTGFILWGIGMAFASLIPIFGTAIVWLPLGIMQMIAGLALNSPSLLYYGMYVLVYGATIVSNIDSFVRPKVMGDLAKVHPLIILVGVIGGLQMMGILGIFLGPIILSLVIKLLSKYYFVKE